jgi:hypothetical protein
MPWTPAGLPFQLIRGICQPVPPDLGLHAAGTWGAWNLRGGNGPFFKDSDERKVGQNRYSDERRQEGFRDSRCIA